MILGRKGCRAYGLLRKIGHAKEALMGQATEDPILEQAPAADGQALTDRRDV
jgi:hypothetical protein